MNKPTPETKTYYNYNECRDYIQTKYGYDVDNFAGRKFTGKPDDPPLLSFWDFLVGVFEINNGTFIYLDRDTIKNAPKEWQKKILNDFLTEFSSGENQELCLLVSW